MHPGRRGSGKENEQKGKRIGRIRLLPLPRPTASAFGVLRRTESLSPAQGAQPRLRSAASVEVSMAGQRVLLLVAFLLSGVLLSEAAKILTISTLGECLAGEFPHRRFPDPRTARAPANGD